MVFPTYLSWFIAMSAQIYSLLTGTEATLVTLTPAASLAVHCCYESSSLFLIVGLPFSSTVHEPLDLPFCPTDSTGRLLSGKRETHCSHSSSFDEHLGRHPGCPKTLILKYCAQRALVQPVYWMDQRVEEGKIFIFSLSCLQTHSVIFSFLFCCP